MAWLLLAAALLVQLVHTRLATEMVISVRALVVAPHQLCVPWVSTPPLMQQTPRAGHVPQGILLSPLAVMEVIRASCARKGSTLEMGMQVVQILVAWPATKEKRRQVLDLLDILLVYNSLRATSPQKMAEAQMTTAFSATVLWLVAAGRCILSMVEAFSIMIRLNSE